MRQKKISFYPLVSLTLLLIFLAGCSSKDTLSPQPPGGPGPGQVLTNVVYGNAVDYTGKQVSLAMDIYFPAKMEAGKKYPVAMQMHGGGFTSGDKSSSAEKCQILADSGFIAATINYRLGWSGGTGSDPCTGDTTSFLEEIYQAVQDGNAALRYLISKADEYSIDTSKVFVTGASAGSVIALNMAYTTDEYAKARLPYAYKKFGSLYSADNNLKNTYTIRGLCGISGALFDSTLINASTAVPTIYFSGELDEVMPINYGTYLGCPDFPQIYGTLCQYRQLTGLGLPAVIHILPGSGHGNNGESGYDNDFMMSNTACFFKGLLQKQAQTQTGVYIGTIDNCK